MPITFAYEIPLIGGELPHDARPVKAGRETIKALLAKTLPFASFMPSRTLGGSNISNLIGKGHNINLCDGCVWKYGKWWGHENYRPDWGWYWITDCDGCGGIGVLAQSFYPEDRFFRVLADNHGKRSQGA